MLIEFEVKGVHIIITGDNVTLSVTDYERPDCVGDAKSKIDAVTSSSISSQIPEPDQIKDLRKSMRLSQTMFARAIGVAQATVSKWESGVERPNGPSAVLLRSLIDEVLA